jgi:hypothetical protein
VDLIRKGLRLVVERADKDPGRVLVEAERFVSSSSNNSRQHNDDGVDSSTA